MTVPSASKRAVVIGGGVAGLATAALLAREGRSVTLLEARSELGGRAGSWEADGFRFDTGPSWYLMPEVFDHFFRLLGTTSAQQLDLVQLDPGYRVFFEDRPDPVDIVADEEANLATFERIEAGSSNRMRHYLDSAAQTYEIALRRFLYNTFASARGLLTADVIRRSGRLGRLLLQPLDRFASRFVSDLRLRQILGYPAVFLGSSPYSAPSMYHLMSHLDLTGGVLYPLGGFSAFVSCLERLAVDAGVEIRTEARVIAINTQIESAASVAGVTYRDVSGSAQTIAADVVVSAADLHHTETQLLEPRLQSYPESWWTGRVAGPGAILVFLGVRGSLPQLAHHSLFFTTDWPGNFRQIFEAPTSIPDPASVYVCRPSASDPSVAPEGDENLFVLIPVPADPTIGAGGVDGCGDVQVEEAADRAIAQIAQWAGIPDLAARIVVRKTVGPEDFRSNFQSWKGSALGPAHTLRQSAFFRGKNVSSRVRGLLYAGATTVPGVGLPMCLISAELVIKRLRDDTTTGPLPEPL